MKMLKENLGWSACRGWIFEYFNNGHHTCCYQQGVEQLENALVQGGRAELRGFGSFDLSRRPPWIALNPKSGEALIYPLD